MRHAGGYRRHRRDRNHAEIVKALEAAGRSVLDLSKVGGGCPDLLVGWGHHYVIFLEVKTSKGALEDSQEEFALWWRGCPVVVVRTAAEALRATGVAA